MIMVAKLRCIKLWLNVWIFICSAREQWQFLYKLHSEQDSKSQRMALTAAIDNTNAVKKRSGRHKHCAVIIITPSVTVQTSIQSTSWSMKVLQPSWKPIARTVGFLWELHYFVTMELSSEVLAALLYTQLCTPVENLACRHWWQGMVWLPPCKPTVNYYFITYFCCLSPYIVHSS